MSSCGSTAVTVGGVEHANPRVIRRCDHVRVAGNPIHGEHHVRLAGGEPHLADQHVVDRYRFAARRHGQRRAVRIGHAGCDCDSPTSLGIGVYGRGLAFEVNMDFGAWSRRTPNRSVPLALQYHVIAEEVWQGKVGLRDRRTDQTKHEENQYALHR